MKTGLVKDRRYKEHNMGDFHPESPQRIEAIYNMIEEEISFTYKEIKPRPATEEEIGMVHEASYIKMVKETSGKERVALDPDTSTSARSYEVALLAAGGLLEAIDLTMGGKIQNGFALVRPPGHHAEAGRAMGFCLFNNVAVGAEYLIKKYKLKRIFIVDWDLHHGNGTQNSFYKRSDVLYASTHQFPHYPGTGYWDEVGEGKGEGFTVNIPLRAGKNDVDYIYIFKKILSPIAKSYKPEFILISAGFDIYHGDPLGGMRVTKEGFGTLTKVLKSLAQELCQGRILFTLEGGYNLQGLKDGVKNVLHQLSAETEPSAPDGKEEITPELQKELTPVFQTQRKYWGSGLEI
jgi:acetoin utilization deacetylase AcuC-like enzyme